MTATKKRTPAQVQHRRDTVRENVARHRARKRLEALQNDELPANDIRSLMRKKTRFVNKTNLDFQTQSRGPPSRKDLDTVQRTGVRNSGLPFFLDETNGASFDVDNCLASHKPFLSLSLSYFQEHIGHPSHSSSAQHHWLMILPQYARVHGSPPCLVLAAHAIAVRAKAVDRPSSDLLHCSGQVYGAALRAFTNELSPHTYTCSNITDKVNQQKVVIALATSLALATYELSDPNPIVSAIPRWASHISGLDLFVMAHGSLIKECNFGQQLLKCWATQRSWLECLSASGACKDLGWRNRLSRTKGADAQALPVTPDSSFKTAPSANGVGKTLFSTGSTGQDALWEFTTTALDLMTSCARALQAALELQSGMRSQESADSEHSRVEGPKLRARVRLLETELSAMREQLNKLEDERESMQTNEQNDGACEGEIGFMGFLQLLLFSLGAELVLSRAEAAAGSVRHKLDIKSHNIASTNMIKIKAELLRVCDVLTGKFGFVGWLCGVLPRALVTHEKSNNS